MFCVESFLRRHKVVIDLLLLHNGVCRSCCSVEMNPGVKRSYLTFLIGIPTRRVEP